MGHSFFGGYRHYIVTLKRTSNMRDTDRIAYRFLEEQGRGALSPLLFALVIEPLAQLIRADPRIPGIKVADHRHKVSVFADDVLLYMTDLN